MPRLARYLVPAAFLLVSICGTAFAGVPSSANSTLPAGIQLVGTSASGVDVKGEALVVVRDAANNVFSNATVEIRFDQCCASANADVRMQPTQPHPGMGWEFSGTARPVAFGVTDGQGRVRFRIVGGAGALPGNNPGITTPCARIIADGQVLGMLRVGAYDLNSSGGVNAADQSLFLGTLFSSPAGYRCRADYNGDGLCNSADLSKILSVQFGAGSGTSGVAMSCP